MFSINIHATSLDIYQFTFAELGYLSLEFGVTW